MIERTFSSLEISLRQNNMVVEEEKKEFSFDNRHQPGDNVDYLVIIFTILCITSGKYI